VQAENAAGSQIETIHGGAADPLLYHRPLHLQVEVYPLGCPLRISTNSSEVLKRVDESWARFSKLFNAAPVKLNIGVNGERERKVPEPPVFRGQGNLVSIVGDAENSAVCDLRAGFGFGWVTPAVAADPDYFRYFFLEALGYTALSGLHLTGIHAACVERDKQGLVLCGDSGAGKSTLAYACVRRGWTYVCDDGTHLVRGGTSTQVIGNCHHLRFRPDAATLFPELEHFIARRRPNGKMTVEVPTSDFPSLRASPETQAQCILFLDRRQGAAPRLVPIDRRVALERLCSAINFGPPWLRAAWTRSFRVFAAGCRAYEFSYWDLEPAVERLEDLTSKGE
jgi:hypothetical protein